MEARYETLAAIFDIVKSDPSPHTYLCTPHQIILRQTQDWFSIQKHLELLAAEKLIIIKQLDKMAILISQEGITKARSLKNNFVNKNYSLQKELPDFSGSDLTK